MGDKPYFPESDVETARLENKTDKQTVIDQSQWAGLKPGMRVLDVGCGPGITTAALAQVAQPGGSAVGVDISEERIEHAKEKYASKNVQFINKNILDDFTDLGEFDFIWARFFLEFFPKNGYQIVQRLIKLLKKDGILCLADLDQNCMNHYGLSKRLEDAFMNVLKCLMENESFDPFVGRKLQQFLYDAGMAEIKVDVRAHHLIYGELSEVDRIHWWHKVELAGKRSGYTFDEYEGGYEEFVEDFKAFFLRPDRFTYTPLIICRGIKPGQSLTNNQD